MKKLLIFFLAIFYIINSFNSAYGGTSVIKDIKTLIIYISNREYKEERFLGEDGLIYTPIDSLKNVLNFEYKLNKDELYINNTKFKYIKKEKTIYISLTVCSKFLGYTAKYDEPSNTVDIVKVRISNRVTSNDPFNFGYDNISSEQTSTQDLSSALALGYWEFTIDKYSSYVHGSVTNNSNQTLSYVVIKFNLYDNYNNQVGDTLDSVNNLLPHTTWKFKAYATKDNASKAKLIELKAY